MSADFHIFMDPFRGKIRVRQEGLYGERVFPSLIDATRHLRECTKGRQAHVVIHDNSGIPPKRIPLHVPAWDVSAEV